MKRKLSEFDVPKNQENENVEFIDRQQFVEHLSSYILTMPYEELLEFVERNPQFKAMIKPDITPFKRLLDEL